MRKLQILFFILLLTLSVFAQKTPEQVGGTYNINTLSGLKQAPVPAGYHPFYISYYGCCGSQPVSDKQYQWVKECFSNDANLTKQGKKVKERLEYIWANINVGQLSPLEVEQQRNTAFRFKRNFPRVFNSSAFIEARSAVFNRCRTSMKVFCRGLSLKIPQYTDSSDMSWIAFNSPEEDSLRAVTHSMPEVSNIRFISALFKNISLISQPDRLMYDLFLIASDIQDKQLKVSLYDIFTKEEIKAIYEQYNLRKRICDGISPDNYGIPQLCAAGLWKNIEQQADSMISYRSHGAYFRFGDSSSLYHLLSLLDASTLSGEMIEEKNKITLMAADLQIIFYTNGKNIIVRFLYNDRNVKLSRDHPSPYYSWSTLKEYVTKRISDAEMLQNISEINTMIGTDYSKNQSASIYGQGQEEHGQTIPAVLQPNGMNFWTPQTRDTECKGVAPYYYSDSLFEGFRDSHWLTGGCTQDYGSFTLMPEMDNLCLKPTARATPFSHSQEVSHPDYYRVDLSAQHLTAEMTGTSRSAIFRFTSQQAGKAYIVVNPNSDTREGFIAVDTARRCIYGYNPVHRIYQGWGKKAGFNGWFIVVFHDPIHEYGVNDSVAWVAFDVQNQKQIMIKAASSFVSWQGAYHNLSVEIPQWDFEETRDYTQKLWLRYLSHIRVQTSNNKSSLSQFYGALYRTGFLPRTFSDIDGRYPSFAGGDSIMRDSTVEYMDYSQWDTYRALNPLNILINPSEGAMMQSLVNMYHQGGWLPIFPCWNSYTAEMIGDHCSASLADAYVKGVKDFDINKAYEGMRKNAFESPSPVDYENGMGRRALYPYLKYGYIPLEDSVGEAFHHNEQVSRTLEYAFDDFAVAQVAKKLGHQDDYLLLMKRAHNYQNVINPVTGWADGRYENGKWLNNKDFVHRMPFITEGAVCHYTWYVPQDVYGLMRIMGGKQRFIAKLDSVFSQNWYWQGNEPCHHIAYMYAYAGEPWKTQKQVRHIMDTEYFNDPGGLPGNDDAGQMSAWYVFSALGFYPVCPVAPYYILGSPVFDKAVMTLVNGKIFTICTQNQSKKNIYIQKAWLNGRPYTRNYLMYDDIIGGGELILEMGNIPNQGWGNRPEDCPADSAENLTTRVYQAKDFGIIGDGNTINTKAIQKAIDGITARGGGKLIFTSGVYLTGSIKIKSNVELHLDSGAIIKGSPSSRDYYSLCNFMPKYNHKIDNSGLGLILAHDAENISLTGDGTIDGNGLAVALDVDSLYHAGIIADNHYSKLRHRPSELVRPSLFNFTECTGVKIQDLHLKNSAGWGLSFDLCRNMALERLKILNRAYWNNDGIDISDCKWVLVRDCKVNSADDGICLKSYHADNDNDHITIRNCEVCSSASAIKFGTASYGGFKNIDIDSIRIKDTFRSAIALECVDGGVLKDVSVNHIEAKNVGNAIFIRLGNRNGNRASIVKDIHIQNLYCEVPFGRPDMDYDLRGPEVDFFHNPFPSNIAGIPGHPVENVLLENVTIVYPGRASKGIAYLPLSRLKDIPELENAYPEFSMFGELPAWGFFARHVKDIIFRNVILRLKDRDFRPAYVFKDVKGCRFEHTDTQSIYWEP